MHNSLRFKPSYALVLLLYSCQAKTPNALAQEPVTMSLPYLREQPVIDADLSEWQANAFHDGEWDLKRVQQSEWYSAKRNRLVRDEGEDTTKLDLSAKYYMAWDERYLYLGAEVHDNVNDASESKHEPKRWYYKDAIAWFIEAPKDDVSEKFGEGDHALCFVIDTAMPDYGAWWRHGNAEQAYIEEPLPEGAYQYAIRMNPWGQNPADYILEARVEIQSTLCADEAVWEEPQPDDVLGIMIVHCDPDGGEYGGHLLIYGKGDDDATWGKMKLSKTVHE